MPTIEILVGMIGSGKSTYALKRAKESALIISHDDLTEMLHVEYRYEQELKPFYRAMMIQLAQTIITAGRDVIIDRTHLTRESRETWIHVARMADVPIIAVVFPIESPEVHATRRFHADARGRPYETWLHVAMVHDEQQRKEPIDISEGFDRIVYMT